MRREQVMRRARPARTRRRQLPAPPLPDRTSPLAGAAIAKADGLVSRIDRLLGPVED
ncbi:MAG TPA: hypothetical protein VML96_07150 [Egibacteraceae bacterium]|nr:hypothetical protein [Egibacteraceae bacterium]